MAVHAAYLATRPALRPTRKWWAATIVAVGGFLTTLAAHSWQWTPEFAGAALTIVTQRVVAYLVPNDDSPGGVRGKTAS